MKSFSEKIFLFLMLLDMAQLNDEERKLKKGVLRLTGLQCFFAFHFKRNPDS